MKKVKYIFIGAVILTVALVGIYYFQVKVDPPVEEELPNSEIAITKTPDGLIRAENGSWMKLNDQGIWEAYLHGDPYTLGMTFGAMSEPLLEKREEVFIGEIANRVPSPAYLNFLKYVVGWFHRDLDEYVPEEYLQEIYGSSQYMSDKYDYVSPKYHRGLSYHAAHDIGHALQNMNLVGCTSFAVKGDKTNNGKLLIGRNFDFYFGEEFAKNRMIAFYEPEEGHKFMSVTWSCFIGVVSGMNEKGLTVTLNSAKSAIPSKGKTPVSIIAREILQYAGNIEEAFTIAKSHDSFVAETFLIGSKSDGKAALIEKTPESTVLYQEDDNEMIITNHFQSDSLQKDQYNQEYLAEGVSDYRFDRVHELIDSLSPLSPKKTAHILRDKKGAGGQDIGLGNEKAINQLIAHHSIIFSPEEMKAWVSTPPYVLGKYTAYDLDQIFNSDMKTVFTYSDTLSLEADPFAESQAFSGYMDYIKGRDKIQVYLAKGEGIELTETEINKMIKGNPNGFLAYYYLGNYYKAKENCQQAIEYYQTALSKNIAKKSEKQYIEASIKECIDQQQ